MSSATLSADVLDVCTRGESENPLLTINSLFADDSFTPTKDARAPKRRKLANGHSAAIYSNATFDESKSALIGKAILDLRLPDASSSPSEDYIDTSVGSIIVSLDAYQTISVDQFSVSLRNPTTAEPSIDILAEPNSDVLEDIEKHFETAVALSKVMFGSKRSKSQPKPGACFCRCLLTPPSQASGSSTLTVEIRWAYGVPVNQILAPTNQYRRMDMDILSKYYPLEPERTVSWSPSDFYDSVHVPPKDITVSSRIQHSLPETSLYPFQQRAVDWLLRREGVAYLESASELSTCESPSTVPVSFQPVKDANGQTMYISHLRGLVLTDINSFPDASRDLRGGILAEEMGLGKTVELIALMCHHTRELPKGDVFDTYTGASVKPSGATLIISPPSLTEQWKTEIHTHAPQLKVTHYKGMPPSTAPKTVHAEATVENLMKYDVVITTYQVLSREVHFANPPPERSLRHEKQYLPRKSPLVQISWWRVCLDEAQMIESGVSQAATVARLIPRCNAWAVTGTPVRKDVQDLRGLLAFLRYEPFAGNKAIWDRLDKPSFHTLFNPITLRHTKDKIRGELQLPPQKRVVITVPFTAIEEQHYAEMIRQMCEACSLSPEGLPLEEGVDKNHPDTVDRMREWLVRLRQTCLHAHVGRKNRKALGAKNGPIRTVQDVLEVMIDQNDTSKKAEAREHILSLVRSGQIKAAAGDVKNRAETALPFFQRALEHARTWVAVSRKELVEEKERLGLRGPGFGGLQEPEEQDSDDEVGQDSGRFGKMKAIRKALRSFLELEHMCKFYHGTTYYQIKSNTVLTQPDSDEFRRLEKLEVDWYEQAKLVRTELLKEVQGKAQRQMGKIETRKPFHQLLQIPDLLDLGGIEGKKTLDTMDAIADLLNAQATQIEKWRQNIVEILLLPLVDQDEEETTGEEYEQSTKAQDELYVYFMALRTLVAYRNAVLTGVRDTLLDLELQHAEELARKKQGHAPELLLQVADICRKLKPKNEDTTLKGAVAATRSLLTALQWKADGADRRAATEAAIVEKQLLAMQKIAGDEAKSIKELEKEQDLFRATMNQRLEFYRQLQHISDTVAVEKDELNATFNAAGFEQEQAKMRNAMKRLEGYETKHKYLVNLREENTRTDVQYECIICKDDFEIGVLTSCGHKYCKECINQWWHSHRTCPLCKTRLWQRDFTDINFKPSAIKAQEETHHIEAGASQASTPGSNASIYSDINDSTMKEIKMIDLNGSYGSKIDMIARHLLWIRSNDAGAKSIIFSQFGDFLEVLREAFKGWKIGCSSISDQDGIHNFRSDPAVECFLLDAKSDSSGLNLVNATYVFLCEPLINAALELQAIARVHRIGQRRATSVFMCLVSGTVEEAIYDISVSRRLAHMGRGSRGTSKQSTPTPALQEQTLDAANSLELEAALLQKLLRKKNEGEVVQADDVWTCLFGKPRKQRSAVLDSEVGRHLRAQAAEDRIAEGGVIGAGAEAGHSS